jgi:hypothetical protein
VLYPRYDLTWPADLAQVTAQRLEQVLDIQTSDWLN